jgi:hypothetical protein
LFDEAFILANFILEATRLFSKAFFLANFTLKAIRLSFKLEIAELFKKNCFLNLALKVVKLSLKELQV